MSQYTDHDREQLEQWLDAYCNQDGTERVLTGKILDYIAATNERLRSPGGASGCGHVPAGYSCVTPGCSNGPAPEPSEIQALRQQVRIERAKFDSALQHLCAITAMLHPNDIRLPDGRVMEFAPPADKVQDYWRGLTDALKAAREHVDSVSPEPREKYAPGWVVEGAWSPTNQPDYWAGSSAWSTDPYKALRFATQQSALQAAELMCSGVNVRICAHEWAEQPLTKGEKP